MIDFILNTDVKLLNFINVAIKNSLFDAIMPVITWGGSFYLVIVAGLLCAFLFKKDKIFYAGSFVAVMFLARYSYRFLKLFFARGRPMFSYDWVNIIGFPLQSYAFPSGHSTVAFTCAVFMSFRFPKGRNYFLTVAAFVAFSRVYMGVHYPSDVLAGAVLGSLIAFLWHLFLEKLRSGRETA